MTYRVKEIYYTLQGEGTQAGRAAVFCRFTSCNLWTGREQDRARAVRQFCDTDFIGTDGRRQVRNPDFRGYCCSLWTARTAGGTPGSRWSTAWPIRSDN